MDRFLARLERRFGSLTIHGLTYYLVAIQAFVFVVDLTRPGFSEALRLHRADVMHGQVWRLVTWLFIPPDSGAIWVLFALYWLYLIGTTLEAQWGSFKYQIYWLVGVVLTTGIAFAFDIAVTNVDLLLSLFLAFATLYPNYEIRVMFLVPIAVKWLALLDAAMLLERIGTHDGLERLIPVLAVGNYLLFFTPTLIDRLRSGAFQAKRAGAFQAFKREVDETRPAKRVCATCGVTDADPSIDFRVCTCEKCGKPTTFCLAHARNH